MTIFSSLSMENGVLKETFIREIPQGVFSNCPFTIFDPVHYREDFTCKCDDPVYRETVMKEWGYTKEDFIAHGIR